MIQTVSFIGAGKVANALAIALNDAGVEVVAICSPSKSAEKLAAKFKAVAVHSANDLPKTDLCIICVNDGSINSAQQGLPADQPRVHSSGSVPMSELDGNTTGVFYPLQTFSLDHNIDWKKVYFCLEASSQELLSDLSELAARISPKQVYIDGVQRKKIHLAAVFACNFSNAMYIIAQKLMKDDELPFEMLHPLIEETAKKATTMPPSDAQTGPAQREDEGIIAQQLKALKSQPELHSLYELITQYIIAQKNEKL